MAFELEPVIAYRRNKNLGDFIGSKKIFHNKVVRRTTARSNFIVHHVLLEEITFAVHKF